MSAEVLIAQIAGYAARFNEADLNGDVIAPGAFAKTLRARHSPVRMLYQHASEAPIGRWTDFRETKEGLVVTGEILLSSPRAREVYALLKGRALDGLSIGYQTVRARKAKAAKGRRILEADLWEVSIVTFPMAPAARLTHVGEPVKDHPDPLRVRSPLPPRGAERLLTGLSSEPGARAFSSPPLNARHFAGALRGAASILSV